MEPSDAPASAATPRSPMLQLSSVHSAPSVHDKRRLKISPFALVSVLAVTLGALVRTVHVATRDFPLNDGGLFFSMTRELRLNGFHLPAFTTYNAERIPFAYSPLPFYVAALVAPRTANGLIEAFRWVPLVATSLTVVAILLLARGLLPSRAAVVAATVAFALVPRSFVWLIMGGGLTRAFGLLFTMLALQQVHALFVHGRLRYAIGLGACAGLTALSHPGTVPFLLFSLLLFTLAFARRRDSIVGIGVAMLVAFAVVLPWVWTVVGMHGLQPFRAAGGTSQSVFTSSEMVRETIGELARLGATSSGEPLFPLVVGLGLLGAVVCLRRRDWLLPVWWVGTIALHLRGGETYASVPLALLAGVGVAHGLLPLLRRGDERGDAHERRLTIAVLAALVVYATAGAIVRHPSLGGDTMLLGALSPDQRATMTWIARATPRSSRFLIVPDNGWAADKTSEWFPVLAERVSVATPQGREWLPGDAFARAVALHHELRACSDRDVACLDAWSRKSGIPFSHVLVPRSASSPSGRSLDASLRKDPRYELLREGPADAVYALR